MAIERSHGVRLPSSTLRFLLSRDDPDLLLTFAHRARTLVKLDAASGRFADIKDKRLLSFGFIDTAYSWTAVVSFLLAVILCIYSGMNGWELLPVGYAANFFVLSWISLNNASAAYAASYLTEKGPFSSGTE